MRRMFVELLKATRQTCEMCKISAGEKVVVFSDTACDDVLVEAFVTAASLVTETTVVLVDTFKSLTNPPEIAVRAMCDADIVFDLATNPWLYTEATEQILNSGTRMLQVMVKSPELIAQRPPTPDILKREEKASNLLHGCQLVRITSEAGSDLVMKRGSRRIHTQGGSVSEPGSWDSYGISLAAFAPLEDQADGVLVVKGTIFAHPEFMVVNDPFRIEVRGGRIVNVENTTSQARYFNSWLKSWDDPASYVIAHTGFGLDDRVRSFSKDDPGGPESYLGSINVAFGSNMFRLLGGNNKAPSHTDIILLDHNFYVDGTLVIENGKFVSAAKVI